MLLTVSCVSHTDVVSIGPLADGTVPLTPDELRDAMAVVESIATENGMVHDPNLEWMGPGSERSKEIDNVVVGLYTMDPDGRTMEWVDLRVVVAKSNGEVVVMVTDLNSPLASGFARDLTEKIRVALDAKLANRAVRVEGRTNPPSLGP